MRNHDDGRGKRGGGREGDEFEVAIRRRRRIAFNRRKNKIPRWESREFCSFNSSKVYYQEENTWLANHSFGAWVFLLGRETTHNSQPTTGWHFRSLTKRCQRDKPSLVVLIQKLDHFVKFPKSPKWINLMCKVTGWLPINKVSSLYGIENKYEATKKNRIITQYKKQKVTTRL